MSSLASGHTTVPYRRVRSEQGHTMMSSAKSASRNHDYQDGQFNGWNLVGAWERFGFCVLPFVGMGSTFAEGIQGCNPFLVKLRCGAPQALLRPLPYEPSLLPSVYKYISARNASGEFSAYHPTVSLNGAGARERQQEAQSNHFINITDDALMCIAMIRSHTCNFEFEDPDRRPSRRSEL